MSWRGLTPHWFVVLLTSYRLIRRKGTLAMRCVGLINKLLKCSKCNREGAIYLAH